MMGVLLALSSAEFLIRLSEHLIGKNTSGYMAARLGKLFDEAKGNLYVGAAKVWFNTAEPFSRCVSLEEIYGEIPADLRLLAVGRGEGPLRLFLWSRTKPDLLLSLDLVVSVKRETLLFKSMGFRFFLKGGRVMKRETLHVSEIIFKNVTCRLKGVKELPLGRSLDNPQYLWTGYGLWVLDGRRLYAYEGDGLREVEEFQERPAIASNGEGAVAFYLPTSGVLRITDVRTGERHSVKDIPQDVGGEFSGIYAVRDTEGKRYTWIFLLKFCREGKCSYVKVKRFGGRYSVEGVVY